LLDVNSNKEYRFAHKLSERHLLVEGANRMSVKLAAHIFSNSVAKSISYLGNKNKINNHNWKEVLLQYYKCIKYNYISYTKQRN